MQIHNENERIISLQVSKMKKIPAGNYTQDEPFLIKNITDNNITLQVLLADDDDYIENIIYPGWNPELVKGIKGVKDNNILIGW